jgi:hypothetical protein
MNVLQTGRSECFVDLDGDSALMLSGETQRAQVISSIRRLDPLIELEELSKVSLLDLLEKEADLVLEKLLV